MEVRLSKHIATPVDLTFDVFSDIPNLQERVDGIVKVEVLSDVSQGVGTRWRETRVMFGREATEEMEISAFRPNQFYEVVASSRGVDYHSLYTFAEKDGGTQVEVVFTGKPTTLPAQLMSLLAGLFKNATVQAFEADMENLKAICEQKAASC